MKRYFVFAYDRFYPSGGMSDFVYSSKTLEDAIHYAFEIKDNRDSVTVWDMKSIKKVYGFYEGMLSEDFIADLSSPLSKICDPNISKEYLLKSNDNE